MRIAITFESRFRDLEQGTAAALQIEEKAKELGLIITNLDIDPHA
ncbi:hypothetical protein [Streptosporangium sp. G12]